MLAAKISWQQGNMYQMHPAVATQSLAKKAPKLGLELLSAQRSQWHSALIQQACLLLFSCCSSCLSRCILGFQSPPTLRARVSGQQISGLWTKMHAICKLLGLLYRTSVPAAPTDNAIVPCLPPKFWLQYCNINSCGYFGSIHLLAKSQHSHRRLDYLDHLASINNFATFIVVIAALPSASKQFLADSAYYSKIIWGK